jgi:hypothetical protein
MKPPGIDPGTVLLVAQRLNHYATPGPNQARVGAMKTGDSEGVTGGSDAMVKTETSTTVGEGILFR